MEPGCAITVVNGFSFSVGIAKQQAREDNEGEEGREGGVRGMNRVQHV